MTIENGMWALLGFAVGVATVGIAVTASIAWVWWRERCSEIEFQRVMREAMVAMPQVLDVERRTR